MRLRQSQKSNPERWHQYAHNHPSRSLGWRYRIRKTTTAPAKHGEKAFRGLHLEILEQPPAPSIHRCIICRRLPVRTRNRYEIIPKTQQSVSVCAAKSRLSLEGEVSGTPSLPHPRRRCGEKSGNDLKQMKVCCSRRPQLIPPKHNAQRFNRCTRSGQYRIGLLIDDGRIGIASVEPGNRKR